MSLLTIATWTVPEAPPLLGAVEAPPAGDVEAPPPLQAPATRATTAISVATPRSGLPVEYLTMLLLLSIEPSACRDGDVTSPRVRRCHTGAPSPVRAGRR